MKIEDLNEDTVFKGICHDCGKHVEVSVILNEKGEIEISGGAVYQVKQRYEEVLFFKCDACFKIDRILKNFRECLVYSRVVGFLTEVSGWNRGKKEEFKMRKEFTNTKHK